MNYNSALKNAKKEKIDNFFTLYETIEEEINFYYCYNPEVFKNKTVLCPCNDGANSNFTKFFVDNFKKFGLKKLIGVSYSDEKDNLENINNIELNSPFFNEEKHKKCGGLFVCENNEQIKFSGYLNSNGDFRSKEVTDLRNESDFIITNPPFSLFREFVAWIFEKDKKFIILGNQNSVTYKEIFPLIKENKLWYGAAIHSGSVIFKMPVYLKNYSKKVFIKEGQKYINFSFVRWFTNVKHGVARKKLNLYSMAHNLKFNKKLRKKLEKDYGKIEYFHYDNYDAIEVPFVECIPIDYNGVMGVPITFLDKYGPEQFEIVGLDQYTVPKKFLVGGRVAIKGKPTYARILIQPTEQFEIVGFSQRGCHDENLELKKYDDYLEVCQNGIQTGSSGKKANGNPIVAKNDGTHNYFINSDGHVVQSCYCRIFIRPKNTTEQFEIVGATGYDDTPCRISRDYKALGYRFYKKDGVTESGSGALRDKTSGKIKCKGNGDYSVSPNGEFLSAVYFRVFIRPKK